MTEMAMESKFVTLYKNQEKRAKRVHLKPSVQSNPPKWGCVRRVYLEYLFRFLTNSFVIRLLQDEFDWNGQAYN